MCPNTWAIVRSVFASDWWSWGTTWFGGNSVIDDAIRIFYPDLSSRGSRRRVRQLDQRRVDAVTTGLRYRPIDD
jgi:hypothetical protein